MNLSFDRFKKTTTENSILSEVTNNDVRDNNKPYTFVEWVVNSNLDFGAAEQYIQQYSTYLRDWSEKNNIKTSTNAEAIKETYRTLLKQITLTFTTSEEKRYLTNIDYSNPADLDAVIPFYATRLKEIVTFLAKKRDETKFQKVKFSLFGTNEGVEKLIKNLILQLADTEGFILNYFTSKPSLSAIAKSLTIQTEEYYDIYDQYFNIDPCEDNDPLEEVHYDPLLFVNFTEAVKSLSNEIGTIIQSGDTFDVTTGDQAALAIVSSSTTTNFENFPFSEFFDYIKQEDNLNLNNQVKLIENLVGNDFTYLSAGGSITLTNGDTQVQYVTGDHIKGNNKISNYFNRRYPTINYKPKKTQLFTKRQLGGFFTPEHLGTLNYFSINPKVIFKSNKIKENTIYEIPDLSIYGNESDNDFIDHAEDVTWVKADRSNDQAAGDIVKSSNLPKFYNYQSKVENNKFSQTGIARVEDNFDFWTGRKRDIWANQDIYKLSVQNKYDLDTKQNDLLISHSYSEAANRGDAFNWQTDIFGNNFVIYKQLSPVHPLSGTTVTDTTIISDAICRLVDGNGFLDSLGNTITSYLSTLSSEFTDTTFDVTAYGFKFLPEACSVTSILGEVTYTCETITGEGGSEDFGQGDTYTLIASSLFVGSTFARLFDGQTFDVIACDTGITRTSVDRSALDIPFLSASIDDKYKTAFVEYNTSVTDVSSIYDERFNVTGDGFVRNINHTIIGPISSALDKTISKFNTTIQDEIKNSLINIDIVYDTIILETTNYKIFEKINYNYKTNKFDSSTSSSSLSTTTSLKNKHTRHFFNENNNLIFTGVTTTSAYGSEIIVYPEIYTHNLDTFELEKVFPDADTDLSSFALPADTGELTEIDIPIITYNELIDRYYITYTCNISGDNKPENFAIANHEFTYYNDKLELVDNILYFQGLSGYSSTPSMNTSETITLVNSQSGDSNPYITNSIFSPVFNLTIDTSSLTAGDFKYIKLLYDWGDGSDIEINERSLVEDIADATADNIDDINNPVQFNKSHDYFLAGSDPSGYTLNAFVSAIRYNQDIEKYKIALDVQPYTIESAFTKLRLVESKSFLDDNFQEKNLLVLESKSPRYITHLLLNGKTYNKTQFTY